MAFHFTFTFLRTAIQSFDFYRRRFFPSFYCHIHAYTRNSKYIEIARRLIRYTLTRSFTLPEPYFAFHTVGNPLYARMEYMRIASAHSMYGQLYSAQMFCLLLRKAWAISVTRNLRTSGQLSYYTRTQWYALCAQTFQRFFGGKEEKPFKCYRMHMKNCIHNLSWMVCHSLLIAAKSFTLQIVSDSATISVVHVLIQLQSSLFRYHRKYYKILYSVSFCINLPL